MLQHGAQLEEIGGMSASLYESPVYGYSKGLSHRNRLAGGSQLISKFLREIEPTVSQFLNVHAFRK